MTDSNDNPPRFSLITLLVAVNVAGVLVWANVHPHVDRTQVLAKGDVVIQETGWPLPMKKWIYRWPDGTIDRVSYHDDNERSHMANAGFGVFLFLVVVANTEMAVKWYRKRKRPDDLAPEHGM